MIIGSVDKTAETQVEKGLDDRNCTHYNIPSLTVGREKNGYKSSKYGRCSRFLSCIDMCYISVFFTTFVFLIIVRIEVFVVIS